MAVPSRLVRAVRFVRYCGSGNPYYRKVGSITITTTTRRSYHELSYSQNGDPANVLEYVSHANDDDDNDHDSSLVSVRMLRTPVNPADLLAIRGRYANPGFSFDGVYSRFGGNDGSHGQEQQQPRVAGSEGIGELEDGTLVTVALPGLGTYRTTLRVPPNYVQPLLLLSSTNSDSHEKQSLLLRNNLSAVATLPQAGGTALGMLQHFANSVKGDHSDGGDGGVVIQNAGNSAVGFLVSQLAKLQDMSCVSIVRRQNKTDKEWQALTEYLCDSGKADLVLAEEEQDKSARIVDSLGQHCRDMPWLALDAVGGDSARSIISALPHGSTMVTYGCLSGKPVKASVVDLVFSDLSFCGYWHSRRMVQRSYEEKQQLLHTLIQAYLDGQLECPAIQEYDLADYRAALEWNEQQQQQTPSGGWLRRKLVFRV